MMKSFLVLMVSILTGCTITILDKHKQDIEKDPKKNHMVAIPIDYGFALKVPNEFQANNDPERSTLHSYLCTPKERKYWQDVNNSRLFYSSGPYRDRLENFTITGCENAFPGRVCIPILYNNTDVCSQSFNTAYSRLIAFRANARQDQRNKANQLQTEVVKGLRENCLIFGFKENSDQLNKCVMEMYKSQQEIEIIRQSQNNSANNMAAYTQELSRLREFEQGMQLLQISSGLLAPLNQRPTTVCRYDPTMRTMRCR